MIRRLLHLLVVLGLALGLATSTTRTDTLMESTRVSTIEEATAHE